MKNYIVKSYQWIDFGNGYGYYKYEFDIEKGE